MKHAMANIKISKFQINNSEEINRFDDQKWYLTDEITSKYLIINWKVCVPDESHQMFIKQFIRAKASCSHQQSGHIYCRSSTLAGNIYNLKKVLLNLNYIFPGKFLSDLNLSELKVLANRLIIKDCGTQYGRGAADEFVNNSKHIQKFYGMGLISDGISCELPKNFHQYLYKDLFKSHKEYLLWKKGGNWNKLPAEISILLISDMLEVIENAPIEFLLNYFSFQRSADAVDYQFISRTSKEVSSPLIESVRIIEGLPKNKHNKLYKLDESMRFKISKLAHIFISAGYTSDSIPMTGEFTEMCKSIQDAAIIVITLLSGARISEIASIKGDSFSKDKYGNHFFTSNIYKTHQGVVVKRSISGEVLRLVNICMNLSYIDKTHMSPFLSKYSGVHAPPSYGNDYVNSFKLLPSSLSQHIAGIYRKWLNKQSKEIKAKAPKKISPHFFRHAFADIALRRFDGRVSESIRRHFAHSYGSNYTKAYTDNKLNDDIQAASEKEYLEEIVRDISNGNKDFYGPVAKRIKNLIAQDHRFLSMEEFDEAVKDLADDFEKIIPHEWGYCVPNSTELAKAQCKDLNTGEVRIFEASGVKNCTHCVHRLTHKSQSESLIRIGISHQNFIENSPLKTITELSQQILNQVRVALREMKMDI